MLVFNIVYREIHVRYGFRWLLASTGGDLFFTLDLILVLVLHLLNLDLLQLVKDVLILLFDGVSKHLREVHVGKVLWHLEELGEVYICACFILGRNELLNQFEIAKGRPYIGRLLQLSTLV